MAKGLGIALLGLGIGALALAASKNAQPISAGGPDLTSEEKGRVEAALTALRALVTAPAKDRRNLILAFQHAARIPRTGALDPLTIQAVEATTQGQVDGDAILQGVKSLQPPAVVPANLPPEVAETQKPSDDAKRSLAEAVAKSIEAKQGEYDHEIVKAFQRAAGIKSDGVYGPHTRAALIAAGISESRLPASLPQRAPMTLQGLAEVVTRNLALAGPAKADKGLLRRFQTMAKIASDGIYGAHTRAALIAAGIADGRLPKVGA